MLNVAMFVLDNFIGRLVGDGETSLLSLQFGFDGISPNPSYLLVRFRCLVRPSHWALGHKLIWSQSGISSKLREMQGGMFLSWAWVLILEEGLHDSCSLQLQYQLMILAVRGDCQSQRLNA